MKKLKLTQEKFGKEVRVYKSEVGKEEKEKQKCYWPFLFLLAVVKLLKVYSKEIGPGTII